MDEIDLGSTASLLIVDESTSEDLADWTHDWTLPDDIREGSLRRQFRDNWPALGLPLASGDVIGRQMGTGADWAVIDSTDLPTAASPGVIIVRLHEAAPFPPSYLAAYLRTARVREQTYTWVPATNQHILEADNLRAIRVPIPPLSSSQTMRLLERTDKARGTVDALLQNFGAEEEDAFNVDDSWSLALTLRRLALSRQTVSVMLARYAAQYQPIMDAYPYPVARATRAFVLAADEEGQYSALLRLIDALTISVSATVLGIGRSVFGAGSVPDQWTTALNKQGVSLGHWLYSAAEVAKKLRAERSDLEDIADSLRPGRLGALDAFEQLVAERNRAGHGGRPVTAEELRGRIVATREPLEEAFLGCAFLLDTRWMYTMRSSYQPATGAFRITAESMLGDHPDFLRTAFSSEHPIAESLVFASTRAGAMTLDPFVLIRSCDLCMAREVYYPNKIRRGRLLLRSFDRGHEFAE